MTGPLEHPLPKSRSATVDIAKGIGIMLVVLGHNWLSVRSGGLHRIIFSFHLPLFFFLSGVFLNPEKRFNRLVIDKSRSLLKPYLLFCIIYILISIMITRHLQWNWIFGTITAIGDALPHDIGAVWFLPHLFLVTLLSWVFVKMSRTWPFPIGRTTIALIALLVAGYCSIGLFRGTRITLFTISMGEHGLPLALDIAIMSSFFFSAGYFFRSLVLQFKFSATLFIAAVLIFAVLHIKYRYSLDFWQRRYDHIVWSTVAAALGIYIVLGISYLLSLWRFSKRWISYIGQGSIFIMAIHGLFQVRSFCFLARIFPDLGYVVAIASFCCGVSMPLVIKEGLFRIKTRFYPRTPF